MRTKTKCFPCFPLCYEICARAHYVRVLQFVHTLTTLLLCRMGSFTSIPKVSGSDNQDDDLEFPKTTIKYLLERCKAQLKDMGEPFDRKLHEKSGKNRDNIDKSKTLLFKSHLIQPKH